MKIISINAGSSSLKFSLFNMDNEELIASGYFERVGIENSFYTIKYNGEKIREDVEMPDCKVAVQILLDRLVTLGILESIDEIQGVGHRIVSGGEKYTKSVIITDKVIQDLVDLKDFAPLHNPAHVLAIKAFKEVLPNVTMVAVFDTAFHQTMDEVSYLYPVPYSWYKEHGVRKYGAHGTSHRYVSNLISKHMKKEDLKVIVCHLGSGGSISAIKNGVCVDTSMGFTPLAGIMMGTRSGDIDSSIIPYVMEKEGLNASEVVSILNKQSGFLGLSQKYSDVRDILDGIEKGDQKCKLALDKYVRTVVNYIASYYVELEGVDAICFTAGVGENSIPTRKLILEKLACFGVKVNEEKNVVMGEFRDITGKGSKVKVFVVPTNEELMIARDTLELLRK